MKDTQETCKLCKGEGTTKEQDRCGCGLKLNRAVPRPCPLCKEEGYLTVEALTSKEFLKEVRNER